MTEEEFKTSVRALIEAELARPVTEDWVCACGEVKFKAIPHPPCACGAVKFKPPAPPSES